jgi:hypothetical protein
MNLRVHGYVAIIKLGLKTGNRTASLAARVVAIILVGFAPADEGLLRYCHVCTADLSKELGQVLYCRVFWIQVIFDISWGP